MVFKGFRFGMLLQLAVGPMCLLVFTTATSQGFFIGLTLVLAIALTDAFYIALSGIGVAAVIGKKQVKTAVKLFGGAVLIIFGLNTFLSVFDLSILPAIKMFQSVSGKNIFLQGLLLTASNPLTIIFWSGVFSSQVIENHFTKKQLCFFGLGCVLSTLFFLTVIALLGSLLSGFLPYSLVDILNGAVGLALIFFGIKLLLKK